MVDNGSGVQNLAGNLRVFSDKGLNTAYDADMPPLTGVEPGTTAIPASFLDGTGNTVLFATKFAECGNGGSRYAAAPDSRFAAFFGQNAARRNAHPSDPSATYQLNPVRGDCLPLPLMAQSHGQGEPANGLSVVLADASARLVSPTVAAETWNRALQPNDGRKLSDDWSQ
jgi:hypothetical protein